MTIQRDFGTETLMSNHEPHFQFKRVTSSKEFREAYFAFLGALFFAILQWGGAAFLTWWRSDDEIASAVNALSSLDANVAQAAETRVVDLAGKYKEDVCAMLCTQIKKLEIAHGKQHACRALKRIGNISSATCRDALSYTLDLGVDRFDTLNVCALALTALSGPVSVSWGHTQQQNSNSLTQDRINDWVMKYKSWAGENGKGDYKIVADTLGQLRVTEQSKMSN